MTLSVQELLQQLDLAKETAYEAGALLVQGFEKEKNIDRKSSAVDWVTEYDQACEKMIVEKLLAANPEHGIMGEEGSRIEGSSPYKWYIDPLDGTNNYAHRFPIFSVSIALYHEETPLVGVVYDPLREEAFHSTRGGGAYLTSPKGERQLKVSDTTVLQQSLLATGFPYDRQTSRHNNTIEVAAFIRTAQGVRRPGSAALDMVYVAAGRLDGYWEYKLYAWDMAAARLIVEEAGGKFTQPDGQPVVMVEKLSLAVSNGHIHQQMLDVLKQAQAERDTIGGE